MDDTRNALGARMGVLGIPLDHITRPEVVPAAFENPREQLMYEVALAGPNFIRDNATVFSLLQSSMDKKDKQSGISHIKPFERAQNGRDAWLALVHHYGADGEQKNRVEMAKMTIKNFHYHDESVLPFENFTTQLTEALHILELAEEGYTENQKVDMILKKNQNKDPRWIMHVETVRSTKANDYPGAVQLLHNMAVQLFPEAHLQSSRGGRRFNKRNINALGGCDGQGKRGCNGGGRGGRDGLGRVGQGGENSNGVDVLDPTRQFTDNERNKLYEANYWFTIQSECLCLNGGGRGGGGRNVGRCGSGRRYYRGGRGGGQEGRGGRHVAFVANHYGTEGADTAGDNQVSGPPEAAGGRGGQNGRGFGAGCGRG